MRYGTSYFPTKEAALRYYRPYYVNHDQTDRMVSRKIAEDEIHIGEPPLKPGEKSRLIDNGTRFEVYESDRA